MSKTAAELAAAEFDPLPWTKGGNPEAAIANCLSKQVENACIAMALTRLTKDEIIARVATRPDVYLGCREWLSKSRKDLMAVVHVIRCAERRLEVGLANVMPQQIGSRRRRRQTMQ